MITKDKLQALLRRHILTVNFLKKDGTSRQMICTLLEDIVKPHVKKTEKTKKPNDEVVGVWDCENDSFRSFRLDSLTDYTIFKEGYEL